MVARTRLNVTLYVRFLFWGGGLFVSSELNTLLQLALNSNVLRLVFTLDIICLAPLNINHLLS